MQTALQVEQECLETTVELENYDLIDIAGMWWDELYHWNIMLEIYKLFRRDRRGGGVVLYVKKWIDGKELPLRNRHNQVKRLWVKL